MEMPEDPMSAVGTFVHEKPHVVPGINVNLSPCSMKCHKDSSHGHFRGCAASPVLIPCPIPRSVTFTVRLGECPCLRLGVVQHKQICPARPIRVSCSISGKTWETSDVSMADLDVPGPRSADELRSTYAACRAHWALVKALVLGKPQEGSSGGLIVAPMELFAQRDAVFSALADMARCERAYWASAKAVYRALPSIYVSPEMQVVDPGDDDGDAPMARWLAAYMAKMIDAVGSLEGVL